MLIGKQRLIHILTASTKANDRLLPVNLRHMKSDMSLPTHRRRPLSMLTTWLLAFAILTVQTLGFMHGVAHRPGSEAGLAANSATTGQPAGIAGEGKLILLFSSHASNADCRLYDHATLGGAALHVASLALPVLLPSFTVASFQGEALARWAALFDARGPPLTC